MQRFEEFTKKEKQKLIDNNETYLRKLILQNKNSFDCDIIKNYNFDKFDFNYDGFQIILTPDTDFKSIIYDIYDCSDIKFELSIDKDRLNTINLDFVLPIELRGLNIGYNIYKLMCKKFLFLTSDYGSSPFAINIWNKLTEDPDFLYGERFINLILDNALKEKIKSLS